MNPMVLNFLAMLGRRPPSTAMSYDYLYDSERIPGVLGDAQQLDFASMPPPPQQETSMPEEMPGFDMEAARRDARRRGLGALGIALLEGAPRGDYAGALARGFAGMAETRQRAMQEAEQRARLEQREARDREVLERQDRLTQAQIENYEEDNRRQRELADSQLKARDIDLAKQQAALERLPPEVQQRLEPFLGTPEFKEKYWDATQPPKAEKDEYFDLSPGETRYRVGKDGQPVPIMSRPPAPGAGGAKAPTTRIWSDGSTRQWNPETKVWEVAVAPGGTRLEKDIQAAADRKFDDWLRVRMARVGEPAEYYKQHPEKIAAYVDKFGTMPKTAAPTPAEIAAARKKFEEEARRQLAPAGGGGNLNLYFDHYGNQIE